MAKAKGSSGRVTESELFIVPARKGRAARVNKGQAIKIINTHGHQVVDTWSFSAEELTEFMSMEHMRPTIGTIFPTEGHYLISNRRRPIMYFEKDTSPGIHDTLMAACDDYRYGLLGCKEYHDNCTDNLHAAMRQIGLRAPETPSPLNLFMNIPVGKGGKLTVRGAGYEARRLRDPQGRDGLYRCHELLPAGHPAHQQRQDGRGALPDFGMRRSGRPATGLVNDYPCRRPSPSPLPVRAAHGERQASTVLFSHVRDAQLFRLSPLAGRGEGEGQRQNALPAKPVTGGSPHVTPSTSGSRERSRTCHSGHSPPYWVSVLPSRYLLGRIFFDESGSHFVEKCSRAVSSVVEHYVDIVGVTSSNLVPPTISKSCFQSIN